MTDVFKLSSLESVLKNYTFFNTDCKAQEHPQIIGICEFIAANAPT